jgi:uncharacterized protein YuzE
MATVELEKFKGMIPLLLKSKDVWTHYDDGADVLYIHFEKPNTASDSELADENTLLRYDDNGNIIGITFMHASKL